MQRKTIINQVGQTVELVYNTGTGLVVANIFRPGTTANKPGGVTKKFNTDESSLDAFFEGSEFNPVLLPDGNVVQYYNYKHGMTHING